MLEQGKTQYLTIVKRSSFGLYLGDHTGEELLLPNKYCTEEMKPGEKVKVFVYRDSEERKVATTQIPYILLHEFALLRVSALTSVGAFMDWGLEKELMVPFKEQRQKMEEGRWYLVYLDLDTLTDRLYASNRLERFLSNDPITVSEGDEVNLVVQQKTDLGFAVIINHKHKGLVFSNEIFQNLNIGDRLPGYVKKIREDRKIDVSLQPIGYRKSSETHSELIIRKLKEHRGFLSLTDKSTPEEIYTQLGISKKAFKKSLGALYRQKKIRLERDGIKLLEYGTNKS